MVWSKLFSQDWKGNFTALLLKWQSENSILLIYDETRWLCQVIYQYSFFRKSYIFPTLQISTESNSWFLFLACLSWFTFWHKLLISSQIIKTKNSSLTSCLWTSLVTGSENEAQDSQVTSCMPVTYCLICWGFSFVECLSWDRNLWVQQSSNNHI